MLNAYFLGVGSILGAGIYTLIGKVAGLSGNFIWLSFLIASVSALFTAFSYAELSAAFPKAGGEYIYAKKAFGKKTGITANTILSNMLGSSRVLLNLSKETKAIKVLSYVSLKRKTPLAALMLILIIMCGFALIGNIETIALIATVFIFITVIIENLSVIVLRIRDKEMVRPYRIPLSIKNIPIISVLGILTTLVLLSYSIYSLII